LRIEVSRPSALSSLLNLKPARVVCFAALEALLAFFAVAFVFVLDVAMSRKRWLGRDWIVVSPGRNYRFNRKIGKRMGQCSRLLSFEKRQTPPRAVFSWLFRFARAGYLAFSVRTMPPINHFLGPLMALSVLALAVKCGLALLYVENKFQRETREAKIETGELDTESEQTSQA
jgi:hypothetical protein